ncbi:MAG TPA: hypothetical protein ENN80_05105, partial [Candidatus Hydrogenedentes bacterium]|nr:hypothetical protein [Candidatus Hydrogenedentota bacterium]
MMDHEEIELSAYLDKELSPEERRRVEHRLTTDGEYAAELRKLERTRTMIATCIESPTFHDRLMAAVRQRAD